MSIENRHTASLEREIRDRAHFIWESTGRPTDKDLELRLEAEKQIKYEHPRSWVEVALEAGARVQVITAEVGRPPAITEADVEPLAHRVRVRASMTGSKPSARPCR